MHIKKLCQGYYCMRALVSKARIISKKENFGHYVREVAADDPGLE